MLKRYAYGHDPAGNRTVEQIDDAPVVSAYDNRTRLLNQSPGGTMRFAGTLDEPATVTVEAYDPAGNRTVEQIDDALVLGREYLYPSFSSWAQELLEVLERCHPRDG
ncbi:MAG TPA: hypothetical protein VIL33_05030 [Rhodothermia bacterium]